ncbi:MAG TPA: serine hydrolase domain-containing protein [Acidimicrobiia bacterium]|nr:serine hydrolase domain-containing protein [Acidimicrobiia bacterium]
MTTTSDPLAAVAAWPVRTAAVAVTSASERLGDTGPLDEALPLASVSKLLTAMAVLVAVEEETLGLDDPAGPDGSTVAHLLAHASGLGLDGARITLPGRKRIYSNAGFELLGELLAARAGMTFEAYATEAVLQPLGMTRTRASGNPAWGAVGTAGDLLALGRELLDPRVLSPAMLARAGTVAFPGLDGVLPGFGRQRPNDWGLGFELRDGKDPHWTGRRNSPRTFGHFGRSGTFLWVDPAAGLACACVTNRDFGPWAAEAWPSLSDDVLTTFGGCRRTGPRGV